MALYARKVDYAACDGDGGSVFVALIKLSKKKGGPPAGFVLYRYNTNSKRPQMIECFSMRDAKQRFPYGIKGGFFSNKEGPWKSTTFWLYEVSVGGGYKVCSDGVWVKVGRPRPVRKKSKRPKFGELSHIYRALRDKIDVLNMEISSLKSELRFYENEDLNEKEKKKSISLTTEISKKEDEVGTLEIEKDGIESEMKFVFVSHKRCLSAE